MAKPHQLDYHDPRNEVPVNLGTVWGRGIIVVMLVAWIVFIAGVGIAWLRIY
ncbi:MAG TPA: hypothetical protein VH475_10220 [Tepidisphaeraceae bacterium]|jgi:hypothetical protein